MLSSMAKTREESQPQNTDSCQYSECYRICGRFRLSYGLIY